jgi:hypothetical protein
LAFILCKVIKQGDLDIGEREIWRISARREPRDRTTKACSATTACGSCPATWVATRRQAGASADSSPARCREANDRTAAVIGSKVGGTGHTTVHTGRGC